MGSEISRLTPLDSLEPAFSENNIPFFFCCDDNFFTYTITSLASAVEAFSPARNYDAFILLDSVKPARLETAKEWIAGYRNVSLRFVDMRAYVAKFGRERLSTTKLYSAAAFFRIFAPIIFQHYGKILYLDSDLLFLSDIAELFEMDLGENCLAASLDALIEERERIVRLLSGSDVPH